MKYFFDTEFIEDGKTIDLMSIGIVADDGRTLYLQNMDCQFHMASDWVWRNVFPALGHFNMKGRRECLGMSRAESLANARQSKCGNECPWRSHPEIRDEVFQFLSIEKFGKPEMWGYYADYDWVAFCQLFGSMIHLPKGFPMYCNDLKQLCKSMGDPKLPDYPEPSNHSALRDAREIKFRHDWLLAKP